MVRLTSSDSNLASFVQPGEILTSRQLQDRLVAAGKTPANARKIISRGHQNGQLWRSEKFRMPGNERLFARAEYWGTRDFCKKVADLIATTTRRGIARCLDAIALDDSFMVGDRWRDIDCGANAGVRTVLIERGWQERTPQHTPDFRAADIAGAADCILAAARS